MRQIRKVVLTYCRALAGRVKGWRASARIDPEVSALTCAILVYGIGLVAIIGLIVYLIVTLQSLRP